MSGTKDLLSGLKVGTYELKEPWRATNKSLTIVVPIVSKNSETRDYFVLEEAKDKIRILDSGGIHEVYIEGDVDRPTFIRGGTMLKGSTQERATQFGFVITPNQPEKIPVHCIHASKGIVAGASMRLSGQAPFRVYSSILSDRNQSRTWEEVRKFSVRAQASASNNERMFRQRLEATRPYGDDLVRTVETIDTFRNDLQELLKHVPDYTNQVGTVVIDPDGILGMEMYDHPESWKAFSKSIIRSFSEALAREDKTGIFKPDMAEATTVIKEFLDSIKEVQEEEVFNRNKARTMIVRTKEYVGEYTTLKGKTIHLLFTRRNPAHPRQRSVRLSSSARAQVSGRSTIQRLVSWGKRKMSKGTQVLSVLEEKPRTWTDLRSSVVMSKATLSNRLKELQESGIVDRQKGQNGVARYSLTGIGQELLQEQKKPEKTKNPHHIRSDALDLLMNSTTFESSHGKSESCPTCQSTNTSIWGFNQQKETWECNACHHKWTTPRSKKTN